MTRVGDAVYRLVLRLLPREAREEFGGDMVQLFRDQRRALGRRPVARLALWIAAVRDVLQQAADARRTARGRRRPSEGRRRPRSLAALAAVKTDVRHGWRLVHRYPGLSIVAGLTLALGLGVNIAIVSVVDAVLWRRLPYPDPAGLVMVWEKRPAEGVLTNVVAPADFVDWRTRNKVFARMAAFIPLTTTLTGAGEPAQIGTGLVSSEFFEVLGVRPALGRTFQRQDERPPGRVLVITHALWTDRFGRDPAVIGRAVQINGNPWTVVGVLPADFVFVDPTLELWAPLVLEGGEAPTRYAHQAEVYARLAAGVSFAQALDAMDRIGRDLEREHPDANRGHGAHVTTLQDRYVQPVRSSLVLIGLAVSLVLLIACANVTGLLVARAEARRREMAVRAALGASRARLAGQSLVESLMLAALAGVAGVGVAYVALEALPLVLPSRLSVIGVDDLSIDCRVLGLAAALALAAGALAGLWPALQAARTGALAALRSGGRSTSGTRRRGRQLLVVAEVAVATLALVIAGLVVRSFVHLANRPLGFAPEARLTFTLAVPRVRYPGPERQRAALEAFEAELAAVPGVTRAGAIDLLPLAGGDSRFGMELEGREPAEGDPPTRMHSRVVTPGYFEAMDIPLVRGRRFSAGDRATAEPVVIISQSSAARFFAGEDPIGRRIRFGGDETWRTIVGVAADVRHWGLTRESLPMVYRPLTQANGGVLTFVLHVARDPLDVARDVRGVVARVDPLIPVTRLETMDALVDRSLRPERASMVLMSTFGLLALLLASIGLYGVMAQLVVERGHDIGLYLTLGATPWAVYRRLLGEGTRQAAVGLAIGLTAGVLLMQIGRALLVDVAPWDPATLVSVGGVQILAALAACLVPARRAMRIDPVHALRQG